jgi:hypothetical protein
MNRRIWVALAAALLVTAWASPARAQLTVTPTSFDFGTLAVGVNATANGMLKNTASPGGKVVRIAGVARCVGTSTEFGLSGINVGYYLEPGVSHQFTVSYAPYDATQDAGCFELTLKDGSGAPLPPLTIPVSGAGVGDPAPRLAPVAALAFGSVTLGTTATQTVTLANVGVADLVIDAVTLVTSGSQGGFTVVEPATLPVTVPPGGSTPLTATYTPTDLLADNALVQIHSNDPGSAIRGVTLSGTGFDPNAVLDVNITSVNVASVAKARTPLTLSVATTNVGALSGNVTIEVVAVQRGVELYRASQTVFSTAGWSAVYTGFGFTPRSKGTVDWTVTLTDGAPDQDIATASTTLR